MGLLAGTLYDPAAAVTKATSALLAMTALDTTNLRLTFTAPANGAVLVRQACTQTGATTIPRIHFGVLDGATVRGRTYPMDGVTTRLAAVSYGQESVCVVSGLTPAGSYTWDAAYSVDNAIAGTNLKYGGPNDASGADAWGGYSFEIWDTPTLLGSVLYDPGTAAGAVMTSLIAMTALDTANARITFTAPASGQVFWRIRTCYTGSATLPSVLLGILDGATVKARAVPIYGSAANTIWDASGLVAVTPTTSYTWDAAYAVQVVSGAGGTLKWGGPNNTSANDAWGGLAYEIWTA
jgi:hypothetical protein